MNLLNKQEFTTMLFGYLPTYPKIKWIVYTVIIFMCYHDNSKAQYYNHGQEPTHVQWCIIETENYNVIFPKDNIEQGQQVAAALNNAYALEGKTLEHEHRKWDVILHTRSATGLAFVAPTPFRSEWFTMQNQTPTCMDWLDLLTAHETRHMVQQSKIDSDMPRASRYILGQQATPLLIGAYLPFWFMEGDATCAETALGPAGSGRMPQFFIKNKARLVEKEPFSFNKTVHGSYKNYTPNAYEMGYLMVGGSREIFQKTIWEDVVSRVAKKPLSLTPFNKGIKESTGINKYQLFDTVFTHYQQKWKKDNKQLAPISYKPVSKENKFDANYHFGTILTNGKLFAYKTTLNDVNRFVIIDNDGREKDIYTPPGLFYEDASAKDSLVAWVESLPHPRWAFRDKTRLKILNINNGKCKTFNDKKRYQAPCLSRDNSKMLIVEVDENHRNYLHGINIQSRKKDWSFTLPDNAFFMCPEWGERENTIISVLLKDNQQALISVNIKTQHIDTIIPYKTQHIANPIEYNGRVYFIGGYTGIDNIYSIDAETKTCYKETNVPFGTRDINISNNKLVFSNYTSDGYELVSLHVDSLLKKPLLLDSLQVTYSIAQNLVKQEGKQIQFDSLHANYKYNKYPRLKNLFNFHSWGPFALLPEKATVYPGVSLMSQNLLGTMEIIAGYKYNTMEEHGAGYANMKYMGLYPVLEINTEYGKRSTLIANSNMDDDYTRGINWNQSTIDFNIYIPLNLSRGKFNTHLQPSVGYQFIHRSKISIPSPYLRNGISHLANAGLYFRSNMQQSRQDIFPNFSITAGINIFKTFVGEINENQMISLESSLTFPGITVTNGIKLYTGYQHKQQDNNLFDESVRLARGYKPFMNSELLTLGADYAFPIAYPDYTLLKSIYFRRVKAALFYDQSWLEGKTDLTHPSNNNFIFKSGGVELTTDLNFFQIAAPLEIGFRTSYLQNNKLAFDLILGASAVF